MIIDEKSCQNCIHYRVCKKWDATYRYARCEWGGTVFAIMLAGLEVLIGQVCAKYQALKEPRNGEEDKNT